MKCKNVRTGAVIETSGKIGGSDWLEIPVVPAQLEKSAESEKKITATVKKEPAKTAAKKPVAKKTGGK